MKHFLKGFLEGKSLAPKWRKKRISCETSFKTPSATHPPAPLAIPFTLRERSYSCKSQWNSIDNSSTSTTCNPIYIAGTILQLQITMEFHRQLIHQHHLQSHLHCGNDPTVANHNGILSTTHPPATLATPFTMRERSYSCKSHWNSVDNSSTSTTCNPIYIAETILQLQITMEFHRQLIHQHHLQSHLHCGNDPTVANHNGILSTAHARKTVDTPFTMRNRSEHDPNMIRESVIFQKTLLRSFNPYKRNLPLKKDCYFTQKKTVISRKKRLLFSSKKDSYFFKPNIIMCMFVAC